MGKITDKIIYLSMTIYDNRSIAYPISWNYYVISIPNYRDQQVTLLK